MHSSTLDWFDTLGDEDTEAGLTAAGYTCVKGKDIYGEQNANRTMYNPIYFKTADYELLANGTLWLTDADSRESCSRIQGANTDKALNYVVLRHIDSGKEFIYVNLHYIVKDQDNYVKDAEGNYVLDENGEKHLVQELQTIYLREILKDLYDEYQLPMIIGGDFNNSQSKVYTWFTKSVVEADGTINSNGSPDKSIDLIRTNAYANHVTNECSTVDEKFENRNTYEGAIDLWFVSKFDGVIRCYEVIDNKSGNKYPSDHIPAKLVISMY